MVGLFPDLVKDIFNSFVPGANPIPGDYYTWCFTLYCSINSIVNLFEHELVDKIDPPQDDDEEKSWVGLACHVNREAIPLAFCKVMCFVIAQGR